MKSTKRPSVLLSTAAKYSNLQVIEFEHVPRYLTCWSVIASMAEQLFHERGRVSLLKSIKFTFFVDLCSFRRSLQECYLTEDNSLLRLKTKLTRGDLGKRQIMMSNLKRGQVALIETHFG